MQSVEVQSTFGRSGECYEQLEEAVSSAEELRVRLGIESQVSQKQSEQSELANREGSIREFDSTVIEVGVLHSITVRRRQAPATGVSVFSTPRETLALTLLVLVTPSSVTATVRLVEAVTLRFSASVPRAFVAAVVAVARHSVTGETGAVSVVFIGFVLSWRMLLCIRV